MPALASKCSAEGGDHGPHGVSPQEAREGGLFGPGVRVRDMTLLLLSSRGRRDGDARTARSRRDEGSGRGLDHRGDAGDSRSRSPGRTSVSDHLKADQAMYAVVVAAMMEKKA